MTNQIRLKRGSGSNPSASDLAVGELAVRTDTGILFTKDDGGSVITLGGGGALSDGDYGDITVSNSGQTFTIDNGVITSAKIANGTITGTDLATNIDLVDNQAIRIGTGNDLVLKFDGTHSKIDHTPSSGSLFLGGDGLVLANSGFSQYYLDAAEDGAVNIRHSGNTKISTSSSGATVTGTLVATAFTGALTGNVTGNASGSSGSCTGNAATATALATARNIGGVSFDGSANINLAGVNTSGNQDTSGTAAIATTVTVADESSDTSCNVLFATSATGNLAPKSGTNLTFNSSSGLLVASGFSGDGSSLSDINASNITSGTLAAARVATLNQNTTGSSASCTGNAATATKLANARTISGTSFDGTGNITLNNSNITNGAGYITSADGGNAATVDGIDSSQFLRSDTADTFSGDLTSSGSARILLKKTDNNVSDHILIYNGTTLTGSIGCEDTSWLRLNQEVSTNIYTPRYIRADNGFFVDGTSKGIDGSGNFIGGTISGASDVSSSAGNNTIVRRHSSGYIFSNYINTTDNSVSSGITAIMCKQSGNDYHRSATAAAVRSFLNVADGATAGSGLATTGGTLTGTLNARAIVPTANNSYALGTASARWSDVFTADFHLSNKGSSNQIDNSWGDYTIQEGKDDLFLINNRNGKMYKFMIKEVS